MTYNQSFVLAPRSGVTGILKGCIEGSLNIRRTGVTIKSSVKAVRGFATSTHPARNAITLKHPRMSDKIPQITLSRASTNGSGGSEVAHGVPRTDAVLPDASIGAANGKCIVCAAPSRLTLRSLGRFSSVSESRRSPPPGPDHFHDKWEAREGSKGSFSTYTCSSEHLAECLDIRDSSKGFGWYLEDESYEVKREPDDPGHLEALMSEVGSVTATAVSFRRLSCVCESVCLPVALSPSMY